MKRILSFILAALILTSSAVSCGKTEPAETNAPETKAAETDIAETDSPAPTYAYATDKITENGIAKAHIVLLDGASDKEKTAADELAYHIKLVSGADISVTNGVQEDSLPIIIATPDSMPELEELFPEDLAWLRTIGQAGDTERYGTDGFAVRQKDGKIYIFGAIPAGALNGVYDFIEENLDIIWIRSDEAGTIYAEMPTIHVVKADYREKSPFLIRYGNGNTLLAARNKYATEISPQSSGGHAHTVRRLVLYSPIYDPTITEYWETDLSGRPLSASQSRQINYWSQLTADTVAATVIADLDKWDPDPLYYSVSAEDLGFSSGVHPEMEQPFEYAPGQFIQPNDVAFLSTVYFTFINRVARKVAEKYPNVTITTLAYDFSLNPPVCEIEDNVSIWFATYNEDLTQDSFYVTLEEARTNSNADDTCRDIILFDEWLTKHPNIMLYTYYWDCYVLGWYERPIWYRFQQDCQYYAANGIIGWYADGGISDNDTALYTWTSAARAGLPADSPKHFTRSDAWNMNLLSFWLYYKLMWNPYEDVDALIVKFCDKVYGEASEYMQEYYDLLTVGWKNGAELIPYEFNARINLYRDQQYYFDYFLDFDLEDGTYYIDAVKAILIKAWEAADDKAKEFIRRPYESFQDWTIVLE